MKISVDFDGTCVDWLSVEEYLYKEKENVDGATEGVSGLLVEEQEIP